MMGVNALEEMATRGSLARSLLLRFRKSDIVRHGTIVFAASTFLNICGFVYHAMMGRSLGVANYGSLYALISGISIVGLPAAIVSPAIARFAAEFRVTGDDGHLRALIGYVMKAFGVLAIVYLIAGALAAPSLGSFLHVPSWAVLIAAVMAAISLILPTLRAVSQGAQDFNGYSLSIAVEAVTKAALAYLFFLKPFGLLGGLLAWLGAQILASGIIGGRLYSRVASVARVPIGIDTRRLLMTIFGSAVASLAITLLVSADVVLVKHFFSQKEAGVYAAASLGGKMLLFVVGFVPLVLLPKATDRRARGESSRSVLIAAFGMLIVFSTGGLAVFAVAGSQVLRLLVGPAFTGASHLLLLYGVAMTLLAAMSVLSSYGIAVHRFAFTIPLSAVVVAELLAIILYHPSLLTVVTILTVCNACATLGMTIVIFAERERRGHSSAAAVN